MDREQAADIVRQLADGLDPTTGEPLPMDAPFQHPQVVRALFVARQVLEEPPPRASSRPAGPEHAGAAWTDDEDRRLSEGHEAGREVKVLAAQHGRSAAAIRARLVRLGRLPPEESRYIVRKRDRA